jgi:RNA polymerase sigma-70 factor, ECF subfamily
MRTPRRANGPPARISGRPRPLRTPTRREHVPALVPPLETAAPAEAAFARVYASVRPKLEKFARHSIGRDEAQDIVHDVFLELWRRHQHGEVDWGSPLEPYLFQATRHRLANVKRRRGREQGFLKRYLGYVIDFVRRWVGLDDGEDERSHRDEGIVGVVDRLVDELPPRCRDALLLVHEEGMSYADAGERLGISTNTIRVQVHRGHRFLRDGLEKAGYFIKRTVRNARRARRGS